jgi:hypothetical protein
MAIDPACSAEYLRKRFGERIWDSPFAEYLYTLTEADADQVVDNLVQGLLIECLAE